MATPSIQGLFGGMSSPEEMQQQATQAKAMQFAQLTPDQQLGTMAYKGGANLGRGLAGAFGVDIQDPTIQRATRLRQLASQYNTNTAQGLREMAAALQATDPESAFQLTQRAMTMDEAAQKSRKEEAEITLKSAQTSKAGFETQELSDKQAAKGARVQMLKDAGLGDSEAMGIASNDTAFSKYIETKKVPVPSDYAVQAQKLGYTAKPYLSDYTPDQVKKMEKGVVANKPTSEFERLVESLPISDDKKQSMKAQRVTSMIAGDSSGLKALSAELAQARIDALNLETRQKKDKADDEKRMAIEKLSGVESSVDTTLNTAEKALKLAPGTMLQATNQALFNNIPFSDAKSMKNLVSSLNSEKALQALEQLKAQSRTGATGFGALTAPELQLIIDKTRSLDPTDKMFRENLGIIMDGWRKIKNSSMDSRINLQGKGEKLSSLKSKVAAVKARGSMTAQEKAEIDALKAELGVN
jgi:hypothetical protein